MLDYLLMIEIVTFSLIAFFSIVIASNKLTALTMMALHYFDRDNIFYEECPNLSDRHSLNDRHEEERKSELVKKTLFEEEELWIITDTTDELLRPNGDLCRMIDDISNDHDVHAKMLLPNPRRNEWVINKVYNGNKELLYERVRACYDANKTIIEYRVTDEPIICNLIGSKYLYIADVLMKGCNSDSGDTKIIRNAFELNPRNYRYYDSRNYFIKMWEKAEKLEFSYIK